ncbi:hypothetical protein FGG08_002636 [Glutinoglossum americanum]|uniref:Rieske domain-containing protein n=1 Tax=Glutinoglossum americanum TaxID=1670608 RepID=A0A9P8L4B9_9PEZI|nr:hypothetical protein FGG08_002636 [Glutinoglossum americanum]
MRVSTYHIRQFLLAPKRRSAGSQRAHLTASALKMAQQYKLKIPSLDLKNGEKVEAEIEGIDKAKVLLLKVADKYHALSPRCTHYGAPLVKGVLTRDGRLTCPWHGACFNVGTGDIENAPAADPLAHYPIIEKDGAVYIEGDEDTIKAGHRLGDIKCAADGQEHVVIVGGGSGCFGTVEGLRGGGFKGRVTVISREPHPPIDRTKLSKALISDANRLILRNYEWFKAASVDLITDDVLAVDFANRQVSTASRKDFSYTKLVLATGGTPRTLPLPGFKELGNIFVLRTLLDVKSILEAVGEEKGRRIVVIGSSFIGMEVAKTLVGKGHIVSVVGMEKAPLERVIGAQVGVGFQAQLEKTGVKFFMEASVDSASPSTSDVTKVGTVNLKDGSQLPADLAILGVGVAPATEFLTGNPAVQLERDGSIKVNEYFSAIGLEDVYAIGDIATYPYHGPGGNGAYTRIEHWNVAQNAGRAVANHINEPSANPKPFIPIFWSALGSQLRYCGNTVGGYDDLVLKGNPEDAKFVAYYTKGETVVAVASMGMDPTVSHASELMRRGSMPSKSEIKSGVDILGVS